jgi:hypothetical protein
MAVICLPLTCEGKYGHYDVKANRLSFHVESERKHTGPRHLLRVNR